MLCVQFISKELFCVKKIMWNNKTSRDILAKIATNIVTIVGNPSYTSGDQKWKGAALILIKKPMLNINKEKFI